MAGPPPCTPAPAPPARAALLYGPMAPAASPVRPVPLALLALACSAVAAAKKTMDCGEGVPLCGSLTLESSSRPGEGGTRPHVHGLWPAVGSYGSSKCVPPESPADPTSLYRCYNQENQTEADLLKFERHEWEKHGRCAGATGADDFFRQTCALSAAPLAAMTGAGTFDAMVASLKSHGYPIWDVDQEGGQVELSACAARDGRWRLAEASGFGAACGGGATITPADETQPAVPPAGEKICASTGRACAPCARSDCCCPVPPGEAPVHV